MRVLVFLAIVLSIIAGLHYYFWARLARDTALPAPYRTWALAALVVLALSMPLALILGRMLPHTLRSALSWPVFVWMGVMFLLFISLLAADLVRVAITLGARFLVDGGALDPERRTLIARLLGAAAGASAGVLGAVGVHQALGALHVKDVPVTLPRLPRENDGMTIAQVTDVHFGPTLGREFSEELVRKCNAIEADIVAITGDLVDGSVESLRDTVAPLAGLRAKHGVYFVTGNHEYYAGADAWLAEIARLGIRVLRNERVSIDPAGGGGFDLAGVDDFKAGGFGPGHGPDLKRALAGRNPTRPVVLLAHQPRQIHEAADHGVDLQLSGHTHAGQIWPFHLIVRLVQPFVAGLGRVKDTQIYVSHGTGYWGPPLRLGTQAEITRIVLRSGPAAGAPGTRPA